MRHLWITLLVGCLSAGCAVEAQDGDDLHRDTQRLGGFDDDIRFAEDPGGIDVALDAAFGEDIVLGADTAHEGDGSGPDPTPWKVSGEEEQAGPDPTPWRDGDDDDDDDDYAASADMGPDPTPWSPDMHSTDDDDDGEPDPQPWQTVRVVGDGNNDE